MSKDKFPHFRFYRPGRHPALIISKKCNLSVEEFLYRKVMHGDRDGRHLNEKVEPNPNSKDREPMYIAKRIRHDKINNFSNWKYPWKYKSK